MNKICLCSADKQQESNVLQRRRRLGALGCAGVLLLAACSDTSSDSETSTLGVLSQPLAGLYSTPVDEPASDTAVSDTEDTSGSKQEPVAPEVAFERDVDLTAKATGLPVDAVRASLQFQEQFALFAEELLQAEPEKIAAIWVDSVPSVGGHVVFVGDVPDSATRSVIAGVELTGGATFSQMEQYERARATSEALTLLGYPDHNTYYDQKTQRLRAALPEKAIDELEKSQLAEATSDRLVERGQLKEAATLVGINDLVVVEKGAPLTPTDSRGVVEKGAPLTPTDSRGGNWVRDDGARECTSGWSVTDGTVDGIATAAHCNGLNQLEEEGGTINSMSFQAQVSTYGDGDVEWHTTSALEPGQFYAEENVIRSVTAYRFTSAMVGQSICHYGRSSNDRTCGHEVVAVNGCYNADAPINGTVCELAETDSENHTIIDGDSGGGWSFNTTAYGVQSSIGEDLAVFTPIEELQDALGILITGS